MSSKAADIRAVLSGVPIRRRAQDGDCIRTSELIQAALPGSRVVGVWGWVDRTTLGFGHRAVSVDGWIVDGSATQYDPALPRLLIQRPQTYIRTMKRATGVRRVSLGMGADVFRAALRMSLDTEATPSA